MADPADEFESALEQGGGLRRYAPEFDGGRVAEVELAVAAAWPAQDGEAGGAERSAREVCRAAGKRRRAREPSIVRVVGALGTGHDVVFGH